MNKLAVPARESLMRAILSRRGRRACLALVFTEMTGQTSLSLVMKVRRVYRTSVRAVTAVPVRSLLVSPIPTAGRGHKHRGDSDTCPGAKV